MHGIFGDFQPSDLLDFESECAIFLKKAFVLRLFSVKYGEQTASVTAVILENLNQPFYNYRGITSDMSRVVMPVYEHHNVNNDLIFNQLNDVSKICKITSIDFEQKEGFSYILLYILIAFVSQPRRQCIIVEKSVGTRYVVRNS